MSWKRIVVFCLVYGFLCSTLTGQVTEASLIPARPGRSPFPNKINKGVLVWEGAYNRSYQEYKNNEDLINRIPITFRYGLLANMEVEFGFAWQSASYDHINVGSFSEKGLAASTIGGKFRIAEEHGAFPIIEFHGLLELPWFGNEAFIPEDVVPSFDFSFLHHLNESTNLSYGFGMFWNPGGENGNYGVKLTKFLNKPNAFFVEHYSYLLGNFKIESHVGGGYILLVNKKAQFDAALDIGKAKDQFFISFDLGYSLLLNPGR